MSWATLNFQYRRYGEKIQSPDKLVQYQVHR